MAEIKFDFEIECRACRGIGKKRNGDWYDDSENYSPCTTCNGVGSLVTDDGRKLTEFLKRWYGLTPTQEPEVHDG